MKVNIQKAKVLSLMFAIFAFFMYFFTIAHPVYPFDIDDWGNMISMRWAHPIPYDWNPTKVLPEMLLPLCTEISYVLSRMIDVSIVDTMTFVTAFLLSAIIVLYYDAVVVFLVNRCHTRQCDSYVISLIFLTLHFMAFSLRYEQNPYFFYSHDLCCFYNYTIPNLLCAIFVLHYLSARISFDIRSYKTSAYLVYLYLLLMSNFYSSIILSAFFSILLLNNFICFVKEKNKGIEAFIKDNLISLVVIIVWLGLHLVELTGGRAEYVEKGAFFHNVILSMKSLKWELYTLTPLFVSTIIFAYLVYAYLVKKKKADAKTVCLFGASSFVAIVYSILVSAKVDTRDMMRSDVLFASFFFFMMAFVVILDSIYKNIKYFRSVSLILLLIFISHCNLPSRSYMDVNNVNPKWGMEFSRKSVSYIKTLEYKKEKNILLPKFNDGDNLPLEKSYGDRIVKMLYKQGEVKSDYHIDAIIDTIYAPRYRASEYEMTYY